MSSRKTHHLSYLLRLWRARQDGRLVWRASLENVQTGERLGFATLTALTDYLLRLDELPCANIVDNAKGAL